MKSNIIDKVKATQTIILERNNGASDQDIYFQLKEEYSDWKGLAILITATPIQSFIDKYKTYNSYLATLLLIDTLLKIFFIIDFATAPNIVRQVLMAAAPLLNIIFAFRILKFQAYAYRACGILTIALTLPQLLYYPNGMTMVVDLILVALIVSLAFYLGPKLFPYFSPKSMQTDRNGDYMLSHVNSETK